MHLPNPPPFTLSLDAEASLPINGLQSDMMKVHAHLAAGTKPLEPPTEQRDVSSWLQRHYDVHRDFVLTSRHGAVRTHEAWMVILQGYGMEGVGSWTVTRNTTSSVRFNLVTINLGQDCPLPRLYVADPGVERRWGVTMLPQFNESIPQP